GAAQEVVGRMRPVHAAFCHAGRRLGLGSRESDYSSAKYRRLMSYSEPASKCFGTHLRQSSNRSCGFQVSKAAEPNSSICRATDSRKRWWAKIRMNSPK